jgi:hypothetical protein
MGVKRERREDGHPLPPGAEIKNARSSTSTPPYAYILWCLFRLRDVLPFTSYVLRSRSVSNISLMSLSNTFMLITYLKVT